MKMRTTVAGNGCLTYGNVGQSSKVLYAKYILNESVADCRSEPEDETSTSVHEVRAVSINVRGGEMQQRRLRDHNVAFA
jgi:hypothetical protein